MSRFLPFLLCLLLSAAAKTSSAEPIVQPLIPGIKVQELPLQLSNINNLRFAPDGRLTALGYDGRVHLLRDTDGDGLEDQDQLFWDKQTLSVPVGMVWAPEGLYVSSHGKVSLLRDVDGDGKADVEEIVASGWPPTDVGSGGVDATAVTRDAEGNLYFGLLVADYSNAYRIKDGVSHYEINSPRGTIQKLSARTHKLETIATGMRVPYTLAFNAAGDLFVTDQEGETWMPNGNPLDELNQIIPGKNYGFPPRHDKWLPNLISEPPIVGFAPQHQSTCGLIFNEPRPNKKPFGPADWVGDAFVAGESRGKIWRVRLVKTRHGYVGKEFLIARLKMLTLDLALSPQGALYVACHSGLPDWGTGPNGVGKIFKLTFEEHDSPQPIAAFPSAPMEVSVAFDRPLDSAITNRWKEMKIEFGRFVSAADRLEVLKPPYQVVQQQEATPRGTLRVVGARLSSTRRTLLLDTDPHPQAARYALTVPGMESPRRPTATIDVAYSLEGVEANYTGDGKSWQSWWPHLDSAVAREFLRGSESGDRFEAANFFPGQLKLSSVLRLPKGRITLLVEANAALKLGLGSRSVDSILQAGTHHAQVSFDSNGERLPLVIEFARTAHALPQIEATYFSDMDPTLRPIPMNALFLPWAPEIEPPTIAPLEKFDFAGADYERGRSLFYGEKLKCATCHRIRGEGGQIGPDLSNVSQRDPGSVLRDIKEPSASIHPDYVAFQLRTRSGEELSGFVRAQDEQALRILDVEGKERSIPRRDVRELRPSAISLMPSGLLDSLSPLEVKDLLVFLTHEAPRRAQLTPTAEKHEKPNSAPRQLEFVLVASKQDHGPGQHDYPAWQKEWAEWLAHAPRVRAETAWEWPNPQQWNRADLILLYFWNHDWTAARLAQVDSFLARGGALVLLHSACIADQQPETLSERIGLAPQPNRSKYRHCPIELKLKEPNELFRDLPNPLPFLDETYWPTFESSSKVEVLGTAVEEGKDWPMLWRYEKKGGRVFGSILGHYTWTWRDPYFQLLILRGAAWAAHEPIFRFDEFVAETQGTR